MIPSKLKTAARVFRRLYDNPANVGHRVMPFVRFFGWQTYKRIARRPWDASVWGGAARLRCHPDSAAASAVLYATAGLADFHEMRFLADYLRPGDHFLDVGANIGVYSLFAAAQTAPHGRVVAFEPGQKAATRLRENLDLNELGDRVEVHQVAVSDQAGRVEFTTGRDSTNQILTEATDSEPSIDLVDAVTLDDITRSPDGSRPRFAAGKMDIEGAEPLAFAGAASMCADANPPVWIIEINGRLRSFGFTESQFETWLADRGYQLALYDGRDRTLRLAPRGWETDFNVLAVHASHWDAVRERTAP